METGEKVHQVPTQSPTFTVAWHPKKYLLAYACDDKASCHGNMILPTINYYRTSMPVKTQEEYGCLACPMPPD